MVFHVLMPLTSNKDPSFPTITWVENKTTNISILPRKKSNSKFTPESHEDEISPFLSIEFIGFSEVVAQPCCTLHHSSVAWVVFAEVFDGERLRKKPV